MKSAFLCAMAVALLGSAWAAAQTPPAHPTGTPVGYSTPAQLGPSPDHSAAPAAPANAPAALLPVNSMCDSGPGQPYGDPDCPPPGCAAGPCGCGPRFYANADYLLWRVRQAPIPNTASTLPVGLLFVNTADLQQNGFNGPVTSAFPPIIGYAPVSIMNNPTPVGTLDPGEQNGARITAGYWFDCDQTCGIEASAFFLERKGSGFSASSGNSINQFLIDTGFQRNLVLVEGGAVRGIENTFPIFFVRQATSSLVASAHNELWGGEVSGRVTCLHFGCLSVGGLLGFRYFDFHEDLGVTDNIHLFAPPGVPLTTADNPVGNGVGITRAVSQDLTFLTNDLVKTFNRFYGAQVGADVDICFGGFFLNLLGKVAVGNMHQTVEIGSTTSVINNDPLAPPPTQPGHNGGLLFAPDDVGQHNRDRISFIPEFGLKVGYCFCGWMRAYVGYEGMFVSNVVRPGNQSDVATIKTQIQVAGNTNTIDVSQPTFRFKESELWINGVSFGLEFRY
jgi:hypothetical protein